MLNLIYVQRQKTMTKNNDKKNVRNEANLAETKDPTLEKIPH